MPLESGGSLSYVRFILVPFVAALTVASTGCGSGAKAPPVASLGEPTTHEEGSSGPIVPKGGSFVKFVSCLRLHGVDAQLGPAGKGVVVKSTSVGTSRSQGAQTACRKYLPGGGPKPLTSEQQQRLVRQLVKLANCMRSHGVPDFPDPTVSANGFLFSKVRAPSSPQFERAAEACGAAGPNGSFHVRAHS